MEKKNQNQLAGLVLFCVGLFIYGITFSNTLNAESESSKPVRSIASEMR